MITGGGVIFMSLHSPATTKKLYKTAHSYLPVAIKHASSAIPLPPLPCWKGNLMNCHVRDRETWRSHTVSTINVMFSELLCVSNKNDWVSPPQKLTHTHTQTVAQGNSSFCHRFVAHRSIEYQVRRCHAIEPHECMVPTC